MVGFFHRLKRLINRWLSAFGFNVQMFLSAFQEFFASTGDYLRFKRMAVEAGGGYDIQYNSPCFSDRNAQIGLHLGSTSIKISMWPEKSMKKPCQVC